MTEWIKCKLSDIGEIVGGATPSTKDPANYDGNIAWLTPKDLSTFNERYIEKGERSITSQGFNSCSTKMLPKNSILFSSRAPIGYVAIAANEMCTNQGFKSVVPNEKVDYMFLYYLLKYNKNIIEGLGSGTTFKEVSGNVMKNIEVSIPKDIKVRKAIAEILDKIDTKIENNNAINRNLYEQAAAVVGNMISNEVEIKSLESICDSIGAGGTPSRKVEEYWNQKDYKWFKNGEIKNNILINSDEYISQKGSDNSSAKPIEPYSILFAMYCVSKPQLAINTEECTTNQAVCVLKIKDFDLMSYIYFYMINYAYDLTNLANGAAQQNLNKGLISNYEVKLPKIETIKQSCLSSIVNQIISLEKENYTLIQMRDNLLPKLMSGKIDISEIEL